MRRLRKPRFRLPLAPRSCARPPRRRFFPLPRSFSDSFLFRRAADGKLFVGLRQSPKVRAHRARSCPWAGCPLRECRDQGCADRCTKRRPQGRSASTVHNRRSSRAGRGRPPLESSVCAGKRSFPRGSRKLSSANSASRFPHRLGIHADQLRRLLDRVAKRASLPVVQDWIVCFWGCGKPSRVCVAAKLARDAAPGFFVVGSVVGRPGFGDINMIDRTGSNCLLRLAAFPNSPKL